MTKPHLPLTSTRAHIALIAPLVLAAAAACSSSKSTAAPAATPPATGATAASGGPGTAATTANPDAGAAAQTSLPPKTGDTSAPGRDSSGSACTAKNLTITVTAVPNPVNHVLITATNNGTAPCYVFNYPQVMWASAQKSPTPVQKDSKPGRSPLSVAPGSSVYAGFMTESADGSGKNGTKPAGVRIALAANGGGQVGDPVTVALPPGTFVDDSSWVTFWQPDSTTALSF